VHVYVRNQRGRENVTTLEGRDTPATALQRNGVGWGWQGDRKYRKLSFPGEIGVLGEGGHGKWVDGKGGFLSKAAAGRVRMARGKVEFTVQGYGSWRLMGKSFTYGSEGEWGNDIKRRVRGRV